MAEGGPEYKSYLLRLWREGDVSVPWRASLKSITEGNEPRHFPNLESLVDFLFAELGTSRPSSVDGNVPDEEG
jgi:hypothetical protein